MVSQLIDNAAERAVLAGICRYGLEAIVDIDFIKSEHFANETNQLLFRCLKDIIDTDQKIEYMSILSTAEKFGIFDILAKNSEITFIRSLFQLPIEKTNIPMFAAKLAKLKLARDISQELRSCDIKINLINGSESVSDIISLIEDPLMNITMSAYKDVENDPKIIGDQLDEYLQYLEENPVDFLGIPTGMPIFDEATGGGIRRKTVALVAARTGVGKSVVATNVGLHVSEELSIPTLYLDTEMDLQSQQSRMLANLSNVKINTIARGKFADRLSDKNNVKKASERLKNIPMYHISVAGASFDSIISIIKRWLHKHVGVDENGKTKDCLVIYDYFKLMSSAGLSAAMAEYQALGFQITQLSDFCITHDIPCLAFVQLNRDNDIAQSDRLSWLASTVVKFEPKSAEELADDGQENGNRKIVILKARHGENLEFGDYINVKMNGATAKISELHTRNMLKSGIVNDSNKNTFETEDESGEDLFNQESDQ